MLSNKCLAILMLGNYKESPRAADDRRDLGAHIVSSFHGHRQRFQEWLFLTLWSAGNLLLVSSNLITVAWCNWPQPGNTDRNQKCIELYNSIWIVAIVLTLQIGHRQTHAVSQSCCPARFIWLCPHNPFPLCESECHCTSYGHIGSSPYHYMALFCVAKGIVIQITQFYVEFYIRSNVSSEHL